MIEKIHIQNFKSIYDLEIEVGRINVFIGENGSGKSNLLEALVFVSASESNMLSNEFLFPRGMRVPEPELMRSAFDEGERDKNIEINLNFKETFKKFIFKHDNQEYTTWIEVEKEKIYNLETDESKLYEHIKLMLIKNIEEDLEKPLNSSQKKEVLKTFQKETKDKLNLLIKTLKNNIDFFNFIIYSPENTALRIFQKEGQIQPLGINGEGLLKLLTVINEYEDQSYIETIIESLQLFNWFEDINIPKDTPQEDKVMIKDKYLYKEFTQRSANEGFLFILFYITLIVAKETPKAFAIDNIDASLNPKLCTKLMTILTELSKKYDKQIFLTTHNPAILDGINLNDEEQKLFVVSRNKKGYTRTKNITVENKPKSSDDEPLKLSEAFLRGYLGGLPKGF